jgi:hypothetical protein
MPNIVGYSKNPPVSSHAVVPIPCPTFSSSLSTAKRLPNSMSSILNTAVPACCISWIAWRDSSYCRVFLPVRKEKMRIWRSGRERVEKWVPEGEKVREVGMDLAYTRTNIEEASDVRAGKVEKEG